MNERNNDAKAWERRAKKLEAELAGCRAQLEETKALYGKLLSEFQLQEAAFRRAPVAVGVLNRQGRYVRTNQAWEDMLGYTLEEFAALSYYDITHPDDTESTRQKLAELFSGRISSYRKEKRYVRKDGSFFWGSVFVKALVNDRGETIEALAMARNITKRKAAQDSLSESELRLKMFSDHVQDMIWATDMEGDYTYVSSSAERLLGYTVEEMVNMGHEGLMGHEYREAVRLARGRLLESLKQGEGQSKEVVVVKLICKDGSKVSTETCMSLLKDPEGKAVGFLGVSRDISQRLEAEEQRLRQEKLSAAIETAGAICHEMNQPLQIIKGRAELMALQCNLAEKAITNLMGIQESVERMGEITRRLQNLTDFRTRHYIKGTRILDLERSAD